jgi:hypothetical protein
MEHHASNRSQVGDIVGWVSFDDDQVCKFTLLHRA